MPSSVQYTEINFGLDVTLSNVTASTLDTAAQNAVCGAVTETVGLGSDSCTITEQVDFRRRLTTGNHKIKATAQLTASTGDFAETVDDLNGDQLFAMLTALLQTAVHNSTFLDILHDMAVDFEATSILFVTNANLTSSTTYAVVEKENDDDEKDAAALTSRQLAGVIIGAIVGFLLISAIVWYVLRSASGAKVAVTGTGANGQGKGMEAA